MARYYGIIGYAETKETTPGIWTEEITERRYFGEVLSNRVRRTAVSDSTNDNVNVNNQISVVADPYAYQNFHKIRYVEFMDVKWNVSNVEVQRPRLILTLGGVCNVQ